MNFSLRLLFITVIFLNLFQLKSQSVIIRKYNIDSIKGDTGNFASNIIIDNKSNKWFFTKKGVYRFDNIDFNFFKLPDALYNIKIKKISISRIAIEKSKKIWLYYNYTDVNNKSGYRLIRYDSSGFTRFDTLDKIMPTYFVNDMKTDSGDTLWIASNNGLAKLKDTVWTIYNTQTSEIPSDTIKRIEYGYNGNMFLSTPQGIFKFDGNRWTSYFNLSPELFKPDIFDNLWFAAEALGYVSLRKFNGSDWSNYWTYSWGTGIQYHMQNMVMDSAKNIWFSVVKNSSPMTGSLKKMRYTGKASPDDLQIDNDGIAGFPTNTKVISLNYDSENNLWIGTDNNLWIYNPNGVKISTNDIDAEKKSAAISINASPIPFSESLDIQFEINSNSAVSLNIYDIAGRLIMPITNRFMIKGKYNSRINSNNLSAGIYFLKINTSSETKAVKIIKN